MPPPLPRPFLLVTLQGNLPVEGPFLAWGNSELENTSSKSARRGTQAVPSTGLFEYYKLGT